MLTILANTHIAPHEIPPLVDRILMAFRKFIQTITDNHLNSGQSEKRSQ